MRVRAIKTLGTFHVRRWLGIDAGRKVLDVGSGHRPHDDATHLLDLLPDDDTERGRPIKRLGRPLVIGRVESLPYKDKAFDYVYASHVLEHTTDPGGACRELMRISRSGYIETPSPFYEQGYNYPRPERGWPFHRWFVFLDQDETLVFEPKTPESIDDFCRCRHAQFVKRIYATVGDLNILHRVLPRECNYTVLNWVGQFKFEVREGGYSRSPSPLPLGERARVRGVGQRITP